MSVCLCLCVRVSVCACVNVLHVYIIYKHNKKPAKQPGACLLCPAESARWYVVRFHRVLFLSVCVNCTHGRLPTRRRNIDKHEHNQMQRCRPLPHAAMHSYEAEHTLHSTGHQACSHDSKHDASCRIPHRTFCREESMRTLQLAELPQD